MALNPKQFKTNMQSALETALSATLTSALENIWQTTVTTLFELNLSTLTPEQKAKIKPKTDQTIAQWKADFSTAFKDIISDVLAPFLAEQLSTTIDAYIKTATVTLPTGAISVTTAGTATAQTGENTAPVVGSPPTGGLS